ncbi:MAG TPA: 7-carboxy-7-deazaguanine synthase QueE [candidate division WOR-3 bacterium]|uniref:7-carboxy-7-deazaguanine synthase n=1 Tax=candidate division WOR-3 bacterium TaxID=2052148 RepID=A0A7V0LU27_UNCW3|nr:MAG: 7-carboxy-7-deazaguanine synthase QueE [Candidatus Hydrothermae bacterium]HDL60283.1 7-carboxy-7-deazaguanine synthase QueE [candidate division WOR-3 bacterium]
MLLISEIFSSIQGEGPRSGVPSIFLRLGGCNLRCRYCDTAYSSFPEYRDQWLKLSTQKVVDKILKIKKREKNLVITGGEPLLQENALFLMLKIIHAEFATIEVETNGTIKPSRLLHIGSKLHFNVSPKLSNSGIRENLRLNPDALFFFSSMPGTIFKFVVKNRKDVNEVEEIIKKYGIRRENVYLMPLAKTKIALSRIASLIANEAIRIGVNYSDRLQIRLWEGERGK